MHSVEIFAGAGGLAIGAGRAGFVPCAVVEWDRDACETLRYNAKNNVERMGLWPIHEGDVRSFDYRGLRDGIELVTAGVPCQPFSIGGKHKGHLDERNMFPELVRAVRELKPKAVLVENVRGLARPSFARYFGYIELMLMYPEVRRRGCDGWIDHCERLERYHTRGKRDGLWYRVVHRVLNAADYGVPQKRERLFMVAIRADSGVEWCFPAPTHSFDSLMWAQYSTEEYWERHRVAKKHRPQACEQIRRRVAVLQGSLLPLQFRPWQTVRDGVSALGVPSEARQLREPGFTHFLIPGARSYVGHCGSPLDEPAKTLKAGVHGVPGGENTLRLPNGSVRYFTVRESARLQTFPDEFVFPGSWTESMRQIGNAVPVALAEILAKDLRNTLLGDRRNNDGGRPV
jgi:DNA (cytosine-5)-methyltransferase 1